MPISARVEDAKAARREDEQATAVGRPLERQDRLVRSAARPPEHPPGLGVLDANLARGDVSELPRRARAPGDRSPRSEEHTSELQSLMRISYAVFCLTKKKQTP